MIQIIGLIIAIYACCRLVQVPLSEYSDFGKVPTLVWLTSLGGCCLIGLLTLALLAGEFKIPH